MTATWTVTNRGTRDTRVNSWSDGLYLSRDASLDYGDYPLQISAVSLTQNGQPKYLKPGESYTWSASFNLPESISGDFHLIVKADTAIYRNPWNNEPSTIREGLAALARLGPEAGTVNEFQGEGNNVASIALPITLATPPDLQVATVTAPDAVVAGQNFTVGYRVTNAGGDTPSDQMRWNDLVYLSKDRFLDVNQDRYVGYLQHGGGLAGGGSYDASLTVTAPKNLEGPYYVFVITDPARVWGDGESGKVREFGNEQNNATTAAQPILIETPPPADLKVTDVVLPASGTVGDNIQVSYTITNDSSNPAFGRWTDALYLSSDNAWDIGDVLLGKVDHNGDLGAQASYSGSLTASLPPLKDGNWRIIVRPDLYNEVFEGKISYTATGLNLPPGEANNRTASGSTLQVSVPVLEVATTLSTTLLPGQSRLYKVSVAAGETLRATLDSSVEEGSNELYIRYGDIPTGYAFDAAYTTPVATDQQALIPSTQAGDYYILVRARPGSTGVNSGVTTAVPITLRADLLPLSISKVTPDQGGTGDDEHRWVTVDLYGSRFKAGALVKLSRPGVHEAEPVRWQVLDATHIRAVFDERQMPHGLYDVTVINPDGERVTEAARYLVERGIEADVALGIGGPRSLTPGESGVYSVSLQSLTNVDTPYVRFDIGTPEMGYADDVLAGIKLPYIVFGTNVGSGVGGQPNGVTLDAAGNTQAYGTTPTDGTPRPEIPWAQLDGTQNAGGFNLAPGYAVDLAAGGMAGMSFNVQTYPGLAEWIAHDFEGLRDKLYALHPEWKEQGLLDGGIDDLDKLIAPETGLAAKFRAVDNDAMFPVHLSKLERLAMPFEFNIAGAATALTRAEFVAEQIAHAKQLRTAILADADAPANLSTLATDEAQWIDGWLGALEAAGLLRPVDEAPPIRDNPQVVSLNATLATGILLSHAGDTYRTQADILGFFAQVQTWYGDSASFAGDPSAIKVGIDHTEIRQGDTLNADVVTEVPVPEMADPAAFDRNATADTHFVNFKVFAGGKAEMEYLRHIGVLDGEFKPVAGQSLNLTQYLQQAAQQNAAANAVISVRGPQAAQGDDGDYVPTATALPYTLSFSNPTEQPAGQLRIVTELDADLDIRSLRLGDLKIGDINVHVPVDRANFQGDFDFTGSKGFVLRVSAGIDASTRIATWLLQAIDPDTGEVLHDATRGLLAPATDPNAANADQLKRGFVSYTVMAADTAVSRAEIAASARILIDDAPPVESERVAVKLDAAAPTTALAVTALGNDAQGAPNFDVRWTATDDASGVKSVTVYVSESDGETRGDFKIWLRQVAPTQTQAVYAGTAGKHYEFLAVATDKAGNREAASVANAVLPDDGSRQEILDALGVNSTLSQTAEIPLAAADRSYTANPLFAQAIAQLPGQVAGSQTSDLSSVLAPFSLRGFADGFSNSTADIGALAMVELPDQRILTSAGSLRNEVFVYAKEGGRSTTPLFTLDEPVMDMAVDRYGQLWVMTGAELLQVDPNDGTVLQRLKGPGQDPLTHALAIQPGTGDIYVSSGNGIEVFNPNATDPTKAWKHFSNQRVGDLAFGPDGRLWAVTWTGSSISGAQPGATTDIVSFPMSGRTAGRPELEYRLAGLIDSISFGDMGGNAGTPLAGLLLASSNLKQRAVVEGAGEAPHQSSVWMLELATKRILQVASGGTRGESIVTTADGRILVAQTGHIDEIAVRRAPTIQAITVPDGSLVPLPLNQIGVVFDQAMWQGEASDAGSILNPANYTLTLLDGGTEAAPTLTPQSIRWDAATRTAWLDVAGLPAGRYQLDISSQLRNSTDTRLEHGYLSTFTALLDMTSQIRVDFSNTRANRATGEVSYDVSLTNIGTDDLRGPLTLLLDPGRYFSGGILDADAFGNMSGPSDDLWTLDLTAALQAMGGQLAVGATLANQTVTVTPASNFATRAGMADLVKFNLGQSIYAAPQDNLPPALTVAGLIDADTLDPATAGQAWSGQIEAIDPDGTKFYWQLLQAPAGVSLTPPTDIAADIDGYHAIVTLNWTPTAAADIATEIVVRVQDSRGGVAIRRFQVPVIGGNSAPVIDGLSDFTLAEGETLSLPLTAADADAQLANARLTLTVRNLPPGAVFDAATGLLTWTPGYDQAGTYDNVTVIASDGKATVSQSFNVTVEQGWAKPVLAAFAPQTLREGEQFGLQLAGSLASMVPSGLSQADGSTVTLDYSSPWLPGGATLNSETGWFEWTPGYSQHGTFTLPVTLTATYTTPEGETTSTSVTRDIVFNVLNANGAPIFEPAETWNILEGQPLRVSVFAFDPDNPDFEPKIRVRPGAEAIPQGDFLRGVGPETTAPTVSYQLTGLPEGASFDADTMEIVWTPGYVQAGSYSITVTATDDGDGTGTPAISQLILPIIVSNANRAPEIGDISNAFVAKGGVIEIPVSASDADAQLANAALTLSLSGLPRFASYVAQTPSSGVIRFTPGEGDRGDYTITVLATDNGGGDVNQVLTQAKSFVLTVTSETEAPVITAPRQVVAVVGQAFSLPLLVSDADQDALTWSANGLPIGATITPDVQYGHATLTWTPTADDLGARDIELVVTDSGLPPQDAGVVNPENPVPNVTRHTLRLVVRDANAAPELLDVQVNGQSVTGIVGAGDTAIQLNATEGVPLSLELFGHDSDTDLIDWSATALPRGMSLALPANDDTTRAVLNWTPDRFAAQSLPPTGSGDSNTGTNGDNPGLWRFSVTGSDGMAHFTRTFEITVANVNQTPRLLPMPLQLVNEGETLSFVLRAADADNDAVGINLVRDAGGANAVPAGVIFDSATGTFEWTPDQATVDNATADSTPYTFTFQATDGSATSDGTSAQTVQVRVFDVNRVPQLTASNHAVVIGDTLSIPVDLGGSFSTGILAVDPDGAAQTAALAISFANLPEGATYDVQSKRLTWTPGPGQIGDHTVSATVSDDRNDRTQLFTLRVVADASANAPKILVSTTPSTPALPGQTIVATIRADAWSGIASTAVEVRGSAVGNSDVWQTVALDAAGRLKLTPTQPGLIDVRVTATDRDGFVSTQTHLVRVRDAADLTAPALAWGGALVGATAEFGNPGQPIDISTLTTLQAGFAEQQLMGYRLQIAAAGSDAWQTLASEDTAAIALSQSVALASLDPATLANGVYQIRLTAWDLVGRTSEIEARVVIDTAQKALNTQTTTDATYTLGGHTLALTRSLDAGQGGDRQADFGNWQLPLLDTQLTNDQPATLASGITAPWREGARVWLSIPESLSATNAATLSLSFTLSTTTERLGNEPGAPTVAHPIFTTSQGWQLQAHTGQAASATENLTRIGSYLNDQTTGLPWVPTGYTLIAPDGSQYSLDANGKVTGVTFADGQQWFVSDAGIAAVGGDNSQRIDFLRDTQGRITRISGPAFVIPANAGIQETSTTVYRYDTAGRLTQIRLALHSLGVVASADSGTQIAYDEQGQPFTDPITATLGTVSTWLGNSTANQWAGDLGDSTTLAFTIRESELAATVHAPGATGAVILALETDLPSDATLDITGASGGNLVIGTATFNGKQTRLIRITEAGTHLIRVSGNGAASVRLSVAGDLNRDGKVDGADSQAWQQAAVGSDLLGDINGDGQQTNADRQVLYANTGFKANLAPIDVTSAAATLPQFKTHTDLATDVALAGSATASPVVEDLEGDQIFWRVLGSSHGSARFDATGQSLQFTPETGYAGLASITVQADDGYTRSAPIELTVNVSGAKLLGLHLAALPTLRAGESAILRATADFEDEQNVAITDARYLSVSQTDLGVMGRVGPNGLEVDDNRDLLRARASGPALVIVTRTDTDGHSVRAVASINTQAAPSAFDPNAAEDEGEAPESITVQPDVYPGTLSLIPGGSRQLKVHLLDPNTGEQTDISRPNPTAHSGTRYFSSDDSIASIGESGLITAHQAGNVTLSVVHLASSLDQFGNVIEQVIGQSDIALKVEVARLTDNDPNTATPTGIAIAADQGGVVQAATGETVLIGAGALTADTTVGIHRIDLADLEAQVGLPVPGAGRLAPLAAFSLDLGTQDSAVPVQLAIPLQNTDAAVGDEILIFRRGSYSDADGIEHATWWLVDNGFVGTDANGDRVARTASPPYAGVGGSGSYVISRRPGAQPGEVLEVGINPGDTAVFNDYGFSLAGSFNAINLAGIFDSAAATVVTLYRRVMGVVSSVTATIAPPAGSTVNVDLSAALPPAETPWGKVVLPNSSAAAFNTASGKLTLTIANANPGAFKGKIIVRALFDDGRMRDIQTLPGTANGVVDIELPDDIAVGTVGWQLVRQIPTDTLSSQGTQTTGEPIEFAGNVVRLTPKPDLMATLTRTGVSFFRENQEVASTDLVYAAEGGASFDALTGFKVQPIAFSPDGSRAYVAGKGVIHVIDLIRFKRIATIDIPAGRNIASLVTVGSTLIIGEGDSGGTGGKSGGYRLLALNINPASANYHKNPVSLQWTGSADIPAGFAGMSIGPDGRTLVVAAPKGGSSPSFYWENKRPQGDVLVFDLATLDLTTGKIADPVTAKNPDDGYSGKTPQTITATNDPDRYLVASPNDKDRGLSTLTLQRDASGKLTGATQKAIFMGQPDIARSFMNILAADRLNIQRAQSAVLVKRGSTEYAIVADDNYNMNDPYFNAMFDAATGRDAPRVNVGGKLGIIKDPFGEAKYLGATIPLDGYGIADLSVSADGKVLVGNLRGRFGAALDELMKQSKSQVWNVDDLLRAALTMPEQDRLKKHIEPEKVNGGGVLDALFSFVGKVSDMLPNVISGAQAQTIGTVAQQPISKVSVTGRYGDVIGVDLQDLIARQLAGLSDKDRAKWSPEDKQKWEQQLGNLTGFYLDPADIASYTVGATNPNPRMRIVLKPDGMGFVSEPYSRVSVDSTTDADFIHSGVLFLAPTITDSDEGLLRSGGLLTGRSINVNFGYVEKDAKGVSHRKRGMATVAVNDSGDANRVFFGDRPLDNPGYSAFTLKGEVSVTAQKAGTIDVLDAYRVEQRLRYLGYSGFEKTGKSTLQELTVDGVWGATEETALRGFYGATHYTSWAYTGTGKGYEGTDKIAAKIVAGTVDNSDTNFNWLNAYNAPHMVNLYAALPVPSNRFTDGQNIQEKYSTSWTYDLLTAWRQTQNRLSQLTPAQQASTLASNSIRINGLTSPSGQYAGHKIGSHSIDMALDLGFKVAGTNGFISEPVYNSSADNSQAGPAIGSVGVAYSSRFTATGNPARSFAVTSGALPTGLVLNATTGWVTGIPTIAGTFTGTVTATNGVNPNVTQSFSIAIGASQGWSVQNALDWSALLPSAGGNNQKGALRNFLSLYNLTISDGNASNQNGSWEELQVVNGDAVRSALFGGGTQPTSVIQHVFVGDGPKKKTPTVPADHNSFPLIRNVVAALGIPVGPSNDHENHFHVDFRTPRRVPIGPSTQNLLVDLAEDTKASVSGLSANEVASFVEQAQVDMGLEKGDSTVFTFDMPDVPQHYASVVIAQASHAPKAATNKERAMGICFGVDYNPIGRQYQQDYASSLSPEYAAAEYFKLYEKRTVTVPPSSNVELAEPPKHGKVVYSKFEDGSINHQYIPDIDYVGDERIVFKVSVDGHSVRLVYLLKVTKVVTGGQVSDNVFCRKTGTQWKISSVPELPPYVDIPGTIASLVTNLAASGNVEVAPLSGSVLAQTDSDGQHATITLDTNAAGHGWYIDYSPYLNEEYLPTANPNEWIAKADSEAAGKMDMLSVLLHEYGHALGIEHSASAHDYMATTLAPGVRRLPSADELALMARLAGDLRLELAGDSTPSPDTPSSPLPSVPLGGSLGLALLGRLRGNRYGGWNVAVDSASLIPQYAVAANPKLSNTEFSGGQGWSTTGDVRFQDGAATLTETAASQTRLNQVFIVGENDRFLSFTVADTALDDADQAPDDAFEVALLDANSGASLLGSTGLTRNDAFLNLQADGNEHKSQAVTSIRNADGSRTYLVDLAGIPAGTAVNLAFDLIGFGKGAAAASSHLTIRDLRIGVPQTKDDSATLAEDTPTTIAALANDLNAQQPGFVPIIVDAPVHGQITINTDGTFSFAPEKDWHGEDHFSYKLSDGHVDSNFATVSLTVTPVNDAPVAAHDVANDGEDGTIAASGNLLANDSDVDTGTVLTVSAPGDYAGTYGTLTLAQDGSYSYALANDSSIIQALRAGEIVSDVFAYAATDGITSTPATLTVTITGTNDGPVTTNDAGAVSEDGTLVASGNLLANDSDADAPQEVPLGDTGTVLTVAAPGDYVGAYGTLTLAQDGSYSYALVNDSAIVQALRAGEIVSDVFAYAATDGITSTPATLTVTITGSNDGPVTTADAVNVDEDGTLVASGNLLVNDSDVDTGTVLTVAAPGDYVGTYGTLTLAHDGSYSYALANDSAIVQALRAGEIVSDVFAYAASDGITTTAATLTVTITGQNDAPVTTNDAGSVGEDGTLVASGNLLANDSDVDTGTVLIVAAPGDYVGTYGTLTLAQDGSYSYALANDSAIVQALREGEIVSDVFAYAATDGITTTPAMLTVTITGSNDGPVTADDAANVGEDGTLAASGNLLANDSDVDAGTVLTVAAPGDYAGAYGTLTLAQDGSYSYALSNDSTIVQALRAGEIVSDVLAYAATDGITSTPAQLTVTITGTNDGPVTADDAANVGEDGTLAASGNLLANDSDVDAGTVLTVVAPGDYVGAYGTLTLSQDGSYSYALTNDSVIVQALREGEIVSDAFAYAASDGLATTPATLTVTITGQNDAPVTADDAASVSEDGTLAAIGNLLANDSDVDTGTVLTIAAPTTYTGAYGTLLVNGDGWYSYTLANDSPAVQGLRAGQVVADVFVYAASDGIASTPATLTIQITGANDGPQAQADAGQAREDGGAVILEGSTLLANDRDADLGDSKTLVAVTDSAAGAQVRLIDGQVVYDVASLFQNLKEGETTTDSFSYTMVDGAGATSTATVTMTIVGANDAPVAQDDAATLPEDGRITLALLGNTSDVDGDALTLRIVDQPAHGMLTLNAPSTGSGQVTVTYVPAANWSGEDVFSYVVNDGLADSNLATVRLIVDAVADAPTLVITDLAGQGREVFRTGWESVRNRNRTSTLVERRELEGWTLITRPDPSRGGSNGFEVWSSGDKMMDAGNKLRIVNAATGDAPKEVPLGDGSNWLELNNAGGHMHQTLGIERRVETVAGATYTLSLDLAGRMGYSADYTRIGILVDGQRIGGDAGTSPGTTLDWQARSVQFTGTGGQQTIRIVSEATRWDKNGRGMMIDDIALVETLPANTGREDSAIPLSAISAGLRDMDGSETLAISIEALPIGALLSDGSHRFTSTEGATTVDLTGWNLGNLTLIPPRNFNGSLSLRVVATATEAANGDRARTTANVRVTVLPVNDAPLAANASYAVAQGGSIRIDFASLVSDVDGNILTLTLSKPKHGRLLKNADGSYTYTPKRGYRGTESFGYTVSDGTLSTTASITVAVSGKRDDDNNHHGGHCARLVVQSGYGNGKDRDDDKAKVGGFIVVNQPQGGMTMRAPTPVTPTIKVDWQGSAPHRDKAVDDGWVRDYFVKGKEQKSLAELTGLVVRLKK